MPSFVWTAAFAAFIWASSAQTPAEISTYSAVPCLPEVEYLPGVSPKSKSEYRADQLKGLANYDSAAASKYLSGSRMLSNFNTSSLSGPSFDTSSRQAVVDGITPVCSPGGRICLYHVDSGGAANHDAAKAVFLEAARIWDVALGTVFTSNVPIRVQARWAVLDFDTLGSAGPSKLFNPFPHVFSF